MKGYHYTLFLFILMLSGFLLQAQEDNEIDWLYEIDLLGRELANKHEDLFFQIDSAIYFDAMRGIAAEASGQTLFEVSIRLQQLIARMGDSHTRINYHFNISADAILPLNLYWFEDGIYITGTRKIFSEILGQRIEAINGYPIDMVIDSLATLLINGNPWLLKSEIPRMITWIQLLEYFGFGQERNVELTLNDTNGKKLLFVIPALPKESEPITFPASGLPLGWKHRTSFFHEQYMDDDNLYYIQYNRCWSREVEVESGSGAGALFMPSFKEFEKQVFRTIKRNDIDKLVFDLRFNKGGISSQGTAFIKKLSRTKFKGNGKLYVLVGKQTSSAAIINTVDFQTYTDAVIVGEGTGGRPNHFGEVKRFVLPESKLVVNYSTKYFELTLDDPPFIQPDIEVRLNFSDYRDGVDASMDAIRKLQ